MTQAQLDIDFDPRRLARTADPSTSHEAAQRVKEFGKGQCAEILELLRRYGPMTAEQIASKMEIDAYSVRKRTADLYNAGKARPNGATAPTISGRHQRVWEAI